jgi:hypothetical protein
VLCKALCSIGQLTDVDQTSRPLDVPPSPKRDLAFTQAKPFGFVVLVEPTQLGVYLDGDGGSGVMEADRRRRERAATNGG